MGNMKSVINSHNNNILRKLKNGQNKAIMKDCNCRDKAKCPLQGKCLSKNIIYKATVETEGGDKMSYIGSTGTSFKTRFSNHKRSFANVKQANSTTLAKHIWHLKMNKIKHTITWRIVQRTRVENGVNRCNLCNFERLEIINAQK